MDGMETGTQENVGGLPAGPEPYNPSGQVMPVDGGLGSSPTPAPGAVASPGSDEYVMQPNVEGASDSQLLGGPSVVRDVFASMPTPDN